MSFNTPHLKVPFRIEGATAGYVEQGTIDELIQNCIAICRTRYGSREDEPDMGVIPQEFDEGKVSRAEIVAAISRDEPRVNLLTETQLDELVALVEVQIG